MSISVSGGDQEVDVIRGSLKEVNFAIRGEIQSWGHHLEVTSSQGGEVKFGIRKFQLTPE